ncbi:STAS domain-containing protein [Mycolicibacterium diernhoferi]|uniref:Anti-sigma factor antagonist n=1 Tax=Mycolicibacterium diernhoferi TaxID=1801 RepID=A0A1Q4HIF9_9MYCO|nr:STAS domain-containing protein [Mycolicibacterium diernhoferi]OJZ67287.1 anti-anti-sigma factor [Mycolicibacterium diernhoferi]OPE55668.1 anti-anti-sigma factor [Mycolicibacterium diernhoferi]PEG53730.1 anti-sigma factor antagonist [Mycolicibacterium diernhoferi]QYL25341.1 STAS domain-containing protein [Mycolicibacterium diernhoferi]
MVSQPEPVVGGRGAVASCTVQEHQSGDVTVLSVHGTLDVLTTPELEAEISAAATKSPACLVVDLSAVDFLGSSGMGALVTAHSDLTPAVRFAIVADGPITSRPLKLIGVADIIDIYSTLDEALTALAPE